MAKISQLPVLAQPTGRELIVAVADDGTARRVSVDEFVASTRDTWQVSFAGPRVVDFGAKLVRYPQMLLLRQGAAFRSIDPANYGIESFDLPFAETGENVNHFHHVDLLAAGNPIRSQPDASVKAPSSSVVPLGNSFWGGYTSPWNGEVTYVRGQGRNQFLDGRTMDGPYVRAFEGGPDNLAPIVSPELIKLGFTRGFMSYDSVGQNLPAPITKNTKVCVSFYAEADLDDVLPATASMYLWSIGGFLFDVVLPRIATLSPRAAQYCAVVDVTAAHALHHFFVGINMEDKGSIARMTGLQFHGSDTPAYSIAGDDYPANDGRLARRDDAAVQRSLAMRTPRPTNLQRPHFMYNLLIGSGQSKIANQEAYPRLTRETYPGTKMLGAGPLPKAGEAGGVGRQYITLDGDYGLHDLAATKTLGFTREFTLTDEEVANPNIVMPGYAAYGEPSTISFVRGARYYLDQHLLTTNDPRQYVHINEAVSGEPLASWLKPNGKYYGRANDAVTKVKAAVGDATIGVIGTLWNGQQFDYFAQGGGVNNKAIQKAGLNKKFDDQQADFSAITGQKAPFLNVIMQTTGFYTVDIDDTGEPSLAIGMAQLEVSLERADVVCPGPDSGLTSKLTPQYGSDHDDANGARAEGWQAAKVFHLMVHLGQDFEPTRPLRWTQEGDSLFGDFHAPVPPLVFGKAYQGYVAVDVAKRGFKVTDAIGDVPIDHVTIVGQVQLRIDLLRKTVGKLRVWYAHQAVGGIGNLRDSDPTTTLDVYKFMPDSGMYPEANIPDLNDKPYPLFNRSVASVMIVDS